ncbi:hypothetical protein L228DRAFT_263176 [Xylona heveae TC161]|uniref:Uncharacterized protein n=1 Tax=Xylona heveae (strain CBS 132557 / TC161) TaxID=1328760 RepID=A0A165A1L6_XYLHT|nr:hypothetical protein L228DRAFT_263176 [Xylona heveae TC161]KZF19828.1 hypothetical protein L228DRAFT_263176 [Xylona heveae TC161]
MTRGVAAASTPLIPMVDINPKSHDAHSVDASFGVDGCSSYSSAVDEVHSANAMCAQQTSSASSVSTIEDDDDDDDDDESTPLFKSSSSTSCSSSPSCSSVCSTCSFCSAKKQHIPIAAYPSTTKKHAAAKSFHPKKLSSNVASFSGRFDFSYRNLYYTGGARDAAGRSVLGNGVGVSVGVCVLM